MFLDSSLTAISVRFTIDGQPERTELTAPWDFNGGGTPTAFPYVVGLAAGGHTIAAVLTRPDGSTVTYSATFTVR